jgi:hypothetical protein
VCAWVGNQRSRGVVTAQVRTDVVQSLRHQRRDLHPSTYPVPLGRSGLIILSPIAGAPIVIAASCRPVMQGQIPPLLRPHRRLGESLLHAGAPLGLLLCHDAGFCLLIGVGLHLLRMRWPSSCKSSSLPRRGSWIVERVPSSRGRKAWWPLRARSGRCTWNMTLVTPVLMPFSGTSSPRRAPPVPGCKSPPTFAGSWRNARFFSAYRRRT